MAHRGFYMIVMDPYDKKRTTAPYPRKVYTNRETAMADIESLVKEQGRRYYLLEATASAVPVSAPIMWEGDTRSKKSRAPKKRAVDIDNTEGFY